MLVQQRQSQLFRLSQPDTLFVSVADVKAHAVITTSADDALLEGYIKAATRLAEDRIGRILMPTEFEFRTELFYPDLYLPVTPVRSVTSVTYLDENEDEQTVASSSWYYVPSHEGTDVRFVDNFGSPQLTTRLNFPVRVHFTAGFDDPSASGSGDDPAFTRDPMDEMIVKILVAHWYSLRGAVVTGTIINEVPFSAKALIDARRVYW